MARQEPCDALVQRLCVVDPGLPFLMTKLARGNIGHQNRPVAAAHQGDSDLPLLDIATYGPITKLEMGEDIEGVGGSWRRLRGSGIQMILWAAQLVQRSLHALELPLRAILHRSAHGVLDCGIQCTLH
eukprot:5167259-Amphidinium_carterae.1